MILTDKYNQVFNVKSRWTSQVRGIFAPSIPYQVRNTTGDWSPYFGEWEGQKHDDLDSNCCWAYAGNEVIEDTLEFLWKTGQFSKDTMDWFQNNGYIDNDGDFYLSRRFIPILSRVGRNGNDPAEFWRLTNLFGAIPNSKLPYTGNSEYFSLSALTPALYALGTEFLKRVSIPYQEVGMRFNAKSIDLLKAALFQSELEICIPIPRDVSKWNQTKVKWDGGKNAQHAVALYKIDEKADYNYPYFIYDQYNPMLKQLSRDYFITIVTQSVISPTIQVVPNPVSQITLGAKIWKAIWEFFGINPSWLQNGDPVVTSPRFAGATS